MPPLREQLEALLAGESLTFLGVVDLDVGRDFDRFAKWREEGRHGSLEYLEKHDHCRRDPAELLSGAQSAIVMALPYDLGDSLTSASPRIAQYARLDDYHRLLWDKGDRIVSFLRKQHPEAEFRVVVDSAPLLERALAAKTAEGFIGKNTCYIHPTKGSFLLLGEILTTLTLPPDPKQEVGTDRKTKAGGCGPCDRCQVHCPTGALDSAYTLDAKKCLSYWTIEHRGAIPEEFWPHLAKYYFGCDLCQLACPYNDRISGKSLPSTVPERRYPDLFVTATMGEECYRKYFGGSALTRAKRNGLRRNALIAMAVTGHPRLGEAMAAAEGDSASPVAETLEQIRNYLAAGQGAAEVFLRGQDRGLH